MGFFRRLFGLAPSSEELSEEFLDFFATRTDAQADEIRETAARVEEHGWDSDECSQFGSLFRETFEQACKDLESAHEDLVRKKRSQYPGMKPSIEVLFDLPDLRERSQQYFADAAQVDATRIQQALDRSRQDEGEGLQEEVAAKTGMDPERWAELTHLLLAGYDEGANTEEIVATALDHGFSLQEIRGGMKDLKGLGGTG